MSWLVLVLAGGLETVWAVALDRSEGFTRLWPSILFFVACAASMAGLAHAMRTIPVGTAYAVWTGLGAVLTVGFSIATGNESAGALKILFLAMIIGGVVGLRFVS